MNFFSDLGEEKRKRKVQQYLNFLESDLGVKVIQTLPDADESGSEGSEATQSTELRADYDEGESITSSERMSLVLRRSGEMIWWRTQKESDAPCFKKLAKPSSTIPRPLTTEAQPRRRPGPWRIMEIFTWAMAVSMIAHSRGWEVEEPLTLPGYDLLLKEDQVRAAKYMTEFDPDFILVVWPCTKWRVLQTFGFRTFGALGQAPGRATAPSWRSSRSGSRTSSPTLCRSLCRLGENPFSSKAWKEPVVIDTWEGLPMGRTEMCAFGLRRPDDEWCSG